jgi:hypothetical protein
MVESGSVAAAAMTAFTDSWFVLTCVPLNFSADSLMLSARNRWTKDVELRFTRPASTVHGSASLSAPKPYVKYRASELIELSLELTEVMMFSV